MTRSMILDAGFELLRQEAASDLTVRAIAQHAGMSERTVFRYFATRDALLDALARHLLDVLAIPAIAQEAQALPSAARMLYEAFERSAEATRAALHPVLVGRVRSLQAEARWNAVMESLDVLAPASDVAQRRIAAANICFHLTASSWNYYRNAFGFALDESIACAETAIRQALQGLGPH